jgi:hypothetical protein
MACKSRYATFVDVPLISKSVARVRAALVNFEDHCYVRAALVAALNVGRAATRAAPTHGLRWCYYQLARNHRALMPALLNRKQLN